MRLDRNTLFYGDNLPVLKDIDSHTVDLVYLDPPFNSARSYNVLFKEESGSASAAQIKAFDDTWHWPGAVSTFETMQTDPNAPHKAVRAITSLVELLGHNQMAAYLVMMTARLIELHRVLKPTGSLYLHCDPTASHYLKVVLDAIFGAENYRSEITWLRSKNPKGSQFQPNSYSPDTDIILFYAKSSSVKLDLTQVRRKLSPEELADKYDRTDERGPFTDGPVICSPSMGPRPNLVYEYRGYTPGPWGWRMKREKLVELDEQGNLGWSSHGVPYRKLRPTDDKGAPVGSCWTDISSLNPQAAERLGYPTQKPLALLERIISASSNPGDIVLDPFCGCGTAVAAAQKLGRRWVGIDITHLSINLMKSRLLGNFNLKPGRDYDVIGEPADAASARALFQQDPFQFQMWALGLVQARPLGSDSTGRTAKKGADRGIDGMLPFREWDAKRGALTTLNALVQVKGGHVSSRDVRDLRGVIERDGAPVGVFITLELPTKEMIREAREAGFYGSPATGQRHARLQLLTVEALLGGAQLDLPVLSPTLLQARPVPRPDDVQDRGLFDTQPANED